MEVSEVWTIDEPFDTILLRFWPRERLDQLILSLSASDFPSHIAEALSPIRADKRDYYKPGIIAQIIKELSEASNLCDDGISCNNIILHHVGLKCVTAAAIRKRLYKKFDTNLGTLKNTDFQRSLIKSLKISTTRQNLGILMIHYPYREDVNFEKSLYHHVIKVLYNNFYLYTAPLSEEYLNSNPDQVRMFVGNQIFRNSDCIVILVDDEMINNWSSSKFGEHMLNSLGWNIRIRILVLGVSSSSKEVVNLICASLDNKSWPIYYENLILAPSGGLISLIKKACQLDFKNSIMKYIHRANVVLLSLENIDQR